MLLLSLGLLATGSAVTVEQQPVNETVSPDSAETVAQYTVNASNASAAVTDILVNRFPFETTFSPANVSVTNESAAINATVHVPAGFEPGTYTGDVAFLFENRSTVQDSITVTVPEVRNWTVTNTSFRDSLSVGSNGDLGTVVFNNTGNVPAKLAVNATGNISQFYDQLPAAVETNAGRQKSLITQYQVRKDTGFGVYTGQLRFMDEANRSEQVNVSVRFLDTELPSIADVTIPDVEATVPADWTVTATDNLNINSIQANVTRTVMEPRQQGNQTVMVPVNRSVGTVAFEHVTNTDQWVRQFAQTGVPATYYVNLSVTDGAGNSVDRLASFTVSELDALEVLETNFKFEDARPADQMVREIFVIDEQTPVNMSLDSFEQFTANASTVVGVRQQGEQSSKTIGVGETITVSDPGTYELVVETARKTRFKGQLAYGVIPQHVNTSGGQYGESTLFRGRFVDPECPEGMTWTSGGYEYEYGYVGGGCMDGQIRLVATAPGETCLGYADAEKCVNLRGFDFGRMDELETQVDRYWWGMVFGVGVGIVSILLTAGVWWFERRIWPYLEFELAKEAD